MDEKLPREAVALVALYALLSGVTLGMFDSTQAVRKAFEIADLFKQEAERK